MHSDVVLGDNVPKKTHNVNFKDNKIRSAEIVANSESNSIENSFEDENRVQTEDACKERGSSSEGNEKIQLEVILSHSIRYKEVTQIDVMVYNNINSRTPLNVEVSMSNECNGCKFQFFTNKCSSMSNNMSGMTKHVSVPYGRPRYATFFIKTSPEIENLDDDIELHLNAKIKSLNYQCSLTKSVKVEPVKVRVYEIKEHYHKLDSPYETKIIEITPDAKYSTKISKIYAELTTNFTSSSQTNYTATFANGIDFNEVFHVTNSNAEIPIEILYPENTRTARIAFRGYGNANLKISIERIFSIIRLNSRLNLELSTLPSTIENEEIVRVCVTYQPLKDEMVRPVLSNVVYDVEMPSGYVYKNIINRNDIPEIQVH